MMAQSRRAGIALPVAVLAAGLFGVGAWVYFTPSCERCSLVVRMFRAGGCWKCDGQSDPPPVALLKELTEAQVRFRSEERGGVPQFWRKDVAGLWGFSGRDGKPIKCVSMSIAGANDRPVVDLSQHVTRAPKSDYWFRSIRHEGETAPDPNRFAFCAFPTGYEKGRKIYIVDERNGIYVRDLGRPGGIDVFPTDPELRQFWNKRD